MMHDRHAALLAAVVAIALGLWLAYGILVSSAESMSGMVP